MTNKHTDRLVLGENLRHEAQLLYQRMLTANPDIRYKIKGHLGFSTSLPANGGECIYADTTGGIYFNANTGAVFALISEDVEELAAGQIGPQGEIIQ